MLGAGLRNLCESKAVSVKFRKYATRVISAKTVALRISFFYQRSAVQ